MIISSSRDDFEKLCKYNQLYLYKKIVEKRKGTAQDCL